MTDPQIIVEFAFGAAPAAAEETLTWTSVRADQRAEEFTRGRSRELDQFQPGHATVVLSNAARQYDPTNLDGPYVDVNGTQILPNVRMRIRADYGTPPGDVLFEGFVDGWAQEFIGPNDAVAVVTATDGFKILAKSGLPSGPFAVDIAKAGPRYWWRLGEPVGSTVAYDEVQDDQLTASGNGVFGEQGLLSFDSDTAYRQDGGATTDGLRSTTAVIEPTTSTQRLNFTMSGSGGPTQGVTSPDHAGLDGLGAIDIRVRWQCPTDGAALARILYGKYYAGSGEGHVFLMSGLAPDNGFPQCILWGTGGSFASPSARTADGSGTPVGVGYTPGQVLWLGMTAAHTAGNVWAVKFYKNTDAVPNADITTWTQLGVTQNVNLGSTTLRANAVLPAVGAAGALSGTDVFNGGNYLNTDVYTVQVRNAVNGTVVADPDFTSTGQGWAVGDDDGDTGTDTSGKVWTIRGATVPPTIVGGHQAFTAEAVVQYDNDGLTSNRTIIQQGDLTVPNYWSLFLNSSLQPTFQIVAGANTGQVNSSVAILDNEFHHVAITSSATGVMKIYLDGVDVTASGDTQLATMTSNGVSIGQSYPASSGANWPGTIDEVVLFDRALSAAEILAHHTATVTPWQGDTTGERLEKILDSVGWPADRRDIDTGDSVLQATGFGSDALSIMQVVSMSELVGSMFIAKDGDLRFISRSNQFDLTPVAALSDAHGTDAPIKALTPDYGEWLLRNSVTITRYQGKPQRAQDLGSIARYFTFSYDLSNLQHDSDELSLAVAASLVEQYATPKLRIGSLTVHPRRDPDLFPIVTALELGEWIDVTWTPQGVGDPVTITSVVEQISMSIGAGQKEWIVTLNLSPAPVDIEPVGVITGDSPPPTGSPVDLNSLDRQVAANAAAIADHIADATAAHAASAISFTPTGTIAAVNVQAAVAETSGDVTSLSGTVSSLSSTVSGHTTSISTLNTRTQYQSAGGSVTQFNSDLEMAPPTAGTTANCNLNTVGGLQRLRKNTSSRRYKENIKDAAIDLAAVLKLRPRTFNRKDDRDEKNRLVPVGPDSPRYVGFIAEEADELGLVGWVVRENVTNADGSVVRQVDGFAYDLFVVAHQAVLRDHQARLEAIEAKLTLPPGKIR